MVVPIGPDEVRQQLGVSVVRFCTRYSVPFPVATDRQWVHGVHLIPGTDERADQQASFGFDPHGDFAGVGGMVSVSDQRVDSSDTLDPLRDPRLLEPVTLAVKQTDIVMLLCPVDSPKRPRLPSCAWDG